MVVTMTTIPIASALPQFALNQFATPPLLVLLLLKLVPSAVAIAPFPFPFPFPFPLAPRDAPPLIDNCAGESATTGSGAGAGAGAGADMGMGAVPCMGGAGTSWGGGNAACE
jgi:hypothetical protein